MISAIKLKINRNLILNRPILLLPQSSLKRKQAISAIRHILSSIIELTLQQHTWSRRVLVLFYRKFFRIEQYLASVLMITISDLGRNNTLLQGASSLSYRKYLFTLILLKEDIISISVGPELLIQLGSWSGITVPDPDLTFLTTNLKSLQIFFKMVQFLFFKLHISLENLKHASKILQDYY